MNFCTDCKWVGYTNGRIKDIPICKRPGYGEINPVTGGTRYPTCSDERDDNSILFIHFNCGPNGKYFQPKDATP